ncbi:Obg family GTPase CgtA [Patescibacteria group bacterium]|nr:Obg family GTPase CgtA [Patescibacteria group bacterium]
MLVDEVVIKASAGSGGDGKAFFRREKYVRKGGPDGGNGGDGGNLYLLAVSDLSALKKFKNVKEFSAEDGKPGGIKKMTGKNGEDLVLAVPIGTKATFKGNVLELTKNQEKILIDEGGKGGRGNYEFRSATNQTPTEFEEGEKKEFFDLTLELQLIADIGLVGKPNAGKSSLLNELSNAKAQIGAFPFTTLEPNLGTLEKIVIADIPGLIEGASSGKGLGIKFLRHINRTRIIAYCISSEEDNPKKALIVLKKELENYNKELIEKKAFVLLTKSDLIDEKTLKQKIKAFDKEHEILPVSIHNFDQIEALAEKLKSFSK